MRQKSLSQLDYVRRPVGGRNLGRNIGRILVDIRRSVGGRG